MSPADSRPRPTASTTRKSTKRATKKVGKKRTAKKSTAKRSTSRSKASSSVRKKTTKSTTKRATSANTSRRGRSGRRRSKAHLEERLHKYIVNCGYCSRRRAELLIEQGLVKINGTVAEIGSKVLPGEDEVTINGERLAPPEPITIILNKPAGTITSTRDTHDRLTVMDLLPKKLVETGILPAGRLDLETEGLLVLTNDGDLQHHITHPSFECEKEYRVLLSRAPTNKEKERLQKGVYLEELEKWTANARLLKIRRRPDGTATLHIYISEGMKRQVRRMFAALDIRVLHLDRLAIAGVSMGSLKRGEWRKLESEEVRRLRSGGDSSPYTPRSGRRGKKRTRRRG